MTIEQAKEIIKRFEDHKKGLDVQQPDHETYARAYAYIAVLVYDRLSREVNESIVKHNGTTI